ncbi:hypothetical protein BCR36DRAFT_580029 [Piromyces finnis]|uniref:CBM10 domain-containing protein n=1 Tax=Piromyces finnis TaxID=1754191 RepID=A0A1Y1VJX8_9FUNG|nr:hypothetical protein BCR36DRAFT_580029 [Piromyces finnis]|eukprot:ORX58402.1 hypothetical protein BCR36DRAFT_580029 [Piromyces finnis]
MKVSLAITTLLSTVFSVAWAAPDPNYHIYLAFGQSNMQGAGDIEGQDKSVDSRFKMLATAGGCNNRRVGEWYDAIPPLANCAGGLGPVDYFGRTLIKELPKEIKVGVAVVAVAGCDIQLFEKDKYQSYDMPDWMKGIVSGYGGNPYGRLIDVGKKAQQYGVIKGILLHQGETNTGQQDWPNRVKGIYDNIIKDLGLNASEVPLLAGEVVSGDVGGACAYHNGVIAKLPQVIPNAHVISSSGLSQQGDGLHFTSAAYRTFGQRYAETMLKLLGDVKVENNGNSNNNQSNNNNQTSTSKKFEDGWYYIKNTGSNKYLSVKGAVGANGQNVQISSTKQKWKIYNNNDGTVLLISEFGDYALDVSNGSGENGANIQIYSIHGGDAQKFIIRETFESNVYVIDTQASNGQRALDVEGARTDEGTNICQWSDEEKSNQTWTIESAGSSGNTNTGNNNNQSASCWSTSLGYSCCKSCINVAYKDNDGEWGIENNNWCGIPKTCQSNSSSSKCNGAQGFPCCQNTCEVYTTDSDGDWGVENNDWCLIDSTKC